MSEDMKPKGEPLYEGMVCIPSWDYYCKCGKLIEASWEYCPCCGHKLWQDREDEKKS